MGQGVLPRKVGELVSIPNFSLCRAALNEASRQLVRAAFAGQPLDLVAVRTDLNFTAALVPLDEN
jgi:hypothetical protein